MKTSLIIPAYFANQQLVNMTRDCLCSLIGLEDNLPDEIILVDDGSPETLFTIPILPFKKIKLKTNSGYSVATNTGLKDATGDILIVGNNDLTFEDGWLEGLLKVLDEGFDLATCWTSDQDYKLEPIIKQNEKFGSLFAMTRQVYETVGGFDEQFRGYFSDLDYQQRVSDAGFHIGKNCNQVVQHKAKATYKVTDPNDEEYLKAMRLYEIKWGMVR